MTIRVADADEFMKWIKRKELEHKIVYEADKQDIYQAIIEVSRDNEDVFLAKLEEVRDD